MFKYYILIYFFLNKTCRYKLQSERYGKNFRIFLFSVTRHSRIQNAGKRNALLLSEWRDPRKVLKGASTIGAPRKLAISQCSLEFLINTSANYEEMKNLESQVHLDLLSSILIQIFKPLRAVAFPGHRGQTPLEPKGAAGPGFILTYLF